MELSDELAGEIQQSWHRFLQRTEALRPDLHRYCLSLTRSLWDAEDLVQDTLLRGFGKLGEFSNPIDNPPFSYRHQPVGRSLPPAGTPLTDRRPRNLQSRAVIGDS
jgi:hypothetical protein